MDKVLVITKSDFEPGFRLAGVKTEVANNSEEAKGVLIKYMEVKKYRIILIDEELTKNFENKFKKRIFESDTPLIMLMPVREKFKEKIVEEDFLKFIISAIGYQIRIK